MNIIKDIIVDYEKLIKTNIQIPLSNGDIIKFTFNPQDLPHLLGLQHLVDNPILFEYSEKRLSATDLYNRMCSEGEDAVDKIYIPYMKEDFRWTNDEKRFILQKLIEKGKDLLPNEVKQLLSEYRQNKVSKF